MLALNRHLRACLVNRNESYKPSLGFLFISLFWVIQLGPKKMCVLGNGLKKLRPRSNFSFFCPLPFFFENIRLFYWFFLHFQKSFSKSNKNFRVMGGLLGRGGLPETNIFFLGLRRNLWYTSDILLSRCLLDGDF